MLYVRGRIWTAVCAARRGLVKASAADCIRGRDLRDAGRFVQAGKLSVSPGHGERPSDRTMSRVRRRKQGAAQERKIRNEGKQQRRKYSSGEYLLSYV